MKDIYKYTVQHVMICIKLYTSLNFYANPVMWEEPTETQNYFELVQSTAFCSHFFNKELMDSTNLVQGKNQLNQGLWK